MSCLHVLFHGLGRLIDRVLMDVVWSRGDMKGDGERLLRDERWLLSQSVSAKSRVEATMRSGKQPLQIQGRCEKHHIPESWAISCCSSSFCRSGSVKGAMNNPTASYESVKRKRMRERRTQQHSSTGILSISPQRRAVRGSERYPPLKS